MTRRLYSRDPYLSHFEAQVVEQLSWHGHSAVVLDQTAFYPESGGQPADRGRIGDAEVLDVVEREEDHAVVHVVSHPLPGGPAAGRVDWQRRFDHMQQHTGQHILSAALEKELEAQTVGFHLGSSSSTVDLDAAGLDMERAHVAEILANDVVWDDRRIIVHVTDADSLAQFDLDPPVDVDGPLRLLVIPGPTDTATSPFDVNLCGGTHVSRTGEVGIIKVVNVERRGDETRLTFLCGHRALQDYHQKHDILTDLASRLTVGYWELDAAVQRLTEENRELHRVERKLREELLQREAEGLVDAAERGGRYRVIGRLWTARSPADLRALARRLADYPNTVALLFSVDDRTHFCFARSEGLELNVSHLLQQTCRALDGKGGGRPAVAQGSAPAAPPGEIEVILGDLLTSLEQT